MTKGVLVTGGTGTFGRAFVPYLLNNYDIERIVVLSRGELEQAMMESDLRRALVDSQFKRLRFYLGDVRDESRLEMAMHGVTHIVHAAALKRIEKCELDPIEAVMTNVMGTINVVRVALRQQHVFNVVGLSTDKACNPVNLYGTTKLAMERILIAANNLAGGRTRFSVVRYGNIWGSRGSVVHIWRDHIKRGLPVPLTNPEATRFFMPIDRAADLVGRQLFKLEPSPIIFPWNMPAYRLADLAEAMGASYEVIGMRENEKEHEELFDGHTSDRATRLTVEDLQRALKDIPT